MARQKIVKVFFDEREYAAVQYEADREPLSSFCRRRILEKIAVPVGSVPAKSAGDLVVRPRSASPKGVRQNSSGANGVGSHLEGEAGLSRKASVTRPATRRSDVLNHPEKSPGPRADDSPRGATADPKPKKNKWANKYCPGHHMFGCLVCE